MATATLRLLALHAEVLRSSASSDNLDNRPFEMLLACHLALRQALDATGAFHLVLICTSPTHPLCVADAGALDVELASAAAYTSIEEYSTALQAVTEALVTETGRSFEHTMQAAKVLLLAGPEGASPNVRRLMQ